MTTTPRQKIPKEELERWLDRVESLMQRGLGTDLQVPSDTGLLKVDEPEIESALAFVRDAADFLAETAELFSRERAEEATDEAGPAGATLTDGELADLAFLAGTELEDLQWQEEQAKTTGKPWHYVALADRASGRAVRALLPIEAALRERLGLSPIARQWFDLDDTLAIRRRFVEFWIAIKRAEGPRGEALRRAFADVESRISELRTHPIYPYLRIDDRLELRSLQKRILAWMEEAEGGDEEIEEGLEQDGRHLWQDLEGFFDLLMQINRRDELRSHDRLLAGRLLRHLDDAQGLADRLPESIYRQMLDLASQEPSLDALLLREEPAPFSEYREPVRRLQKRLAAQT